ncbi:MAG: hypothetical protein KA444_09975, partial [Bacteroidia bacterium]|nr:hypothetical protein [Bacteroidia bacterium]
MGNIFLRIFYFFENHRRLFYGTLIASMLVLLFFASKVKLQENVSQMLPQDKATEKLNKFYQNSRISDRILFRITAKDSSTTA